MTPAELRPYLVALDKSLTDLERDSAESAAAITECSKSMEQMALVVSEMSGVLAQLHDEVRLLNSRLGAYINDAAKERSGVRDVDRRLRAVENKLGA
jgi:hypothetical protein